MSSTQWQSPGDWAVQLPAGLQRTWPPHCWDPFPNSQATGQKCPGGVEHRCVDWTRKRQKAVNGSSTLAEEQASLKLDCRQDFLRLPSPPKLLPVPGKHLMGGDPRESVNSCAIKMSTVWLSLEAGGWGQDFPPQKITMPNRSPFNSLHLPGPF